MTPRTELVIIAALARDRGIGIDNRLPWRLRRDLMRFRQTTMGHPIIMGRKTWESLGRPLPGRRNIVVSRDPAYHAAGAELACSVDAALALARRAERAFVIGGAQIYAAALPLADRLMLTEVDALSDADVHFPAWSPTEFREVSREHHPADSENEYPVDFVEYRRVSAA